MITLLLDLLNVIVSALCTVGTGYEIFNRVIGDSTDVGLMIVLWLVFFVSASCFINSFVDLFRDIDKS
jgi:hypothetical protein